MTYNADHTNSGRCEGEGGWLFGGQGWVKKEGRVPVPKRVREWGVLSVGDECSWGYEATPSGYRITLAGAELSAIDQIGSTKLGGKKDKYRLTIPFQFCRGHSDSHEQAARRSEVPDTLRVSENQPLYFVVPDLESPTWCYLLTLDQFQGGLSFARSDDHPPTDQPSPTHSIR